MMFFGRKPSVQIRALDRKDAAGCAELHAAAFPRGWDSAEFRTLLDDPSVAGDAAVAGEKILGFILTRRALDEAEVLTIAVDRKSRGAGIATTLLIRHIERLNGLGVSAIYLEVESGNAPALALYARAGFRQVGERRAYYRTATGAPAAALILKREAAGVP